MAILPSVFTDGIGVEIIIFEPSHSLTKPHFVIVISSFSPVLHCCHNILKSTLSIYLHRVFELWLIALWQHKKLSGLHTTACLYCTCKHIHLKIMVKDYLRAWGICILPQQAGNKSGVNFAPITLWIQFLAWCSVNRNNIDLFLQWICLFVVMLML